MSDPTLVFNGIDGETGDYLLPPLGVHQVSKLAQGHGIDTEQRQELRARHLRLQPTYAVKAGVDPDDLAQSGWGVIFGQGADPAITDALGELIAYRREQAGDRFRIFDGDDAYRPGESKDAFLKRHRVGPGPADPERVPYYLLLVGDPETIPWRFQYQLDVQYAVGRLQLDTVEAYASYARSVVAAERGETRRDRTAAFFGVRNAGDPATEISADDLVAPLAARLGEQFSAGPKPWRTTLIAPRDATRPRLLSLLGGEDTPALLFTASHGVGFRRTDARQLRHQGALLCQEWPGPGQPGRVERDFYVAADDVDDDARPFGLVAFHFACYGVGTPRLDEFAHRAGGDAPAVIAERAFVAPLPRRLLAHPRGGALAVIGHVERAWGCSIRWGEAGAQIEAFRSALHALMAGHRVGFALEPINGRYAEISTDLGAALEDIRFGRRPDDRMLAWMWTANNDARAYAVAGDPAVRLAVGDDTAEAAPAIARVPAPVPAPSGPRPVGTAGIEPIAGQSSRGSGEDGVSTVTGSGATSLALASVVAQGGRAIRLVDRDAARPVGARVERAELTIQAVLERGAGGELELRVPIPDDAGDGSGGSASGIQVVALTLRPVGGAGAGDGGDAGAGLAASILGLRNAIRAAVVDLPGLELELARIELGFVMTEEGHIRPLAAGDRFGEAAHTLTLHIAPSSA